jgi:hypothetical protein
VRNRTWPVSMKSSATSVWNIRACPGANARSGQGRQADP